MRSIKSNSGLYHTYSYSNQLKGWKQLKALSADP